MRTRVQQTILSAVIAGCVTMATNAAITTNQTGSNGGYFYSFWRASSSGTVSMTLGSGGNYSVSYSSCPDFTCGKGWSTGSARTVGYNAGSYSDSGGGSLALYGWTTSPLIEYYVNEMWGSSRPTGTSVGTLSSDGGSYNVYKHQQVNQPSIQGTATFWQYFSTRTSKNSTGANHSITLATHFNYWKAYIGSMGAYNVMYMCTEAWGGASGYCNVTVW